MADNTKNSAEQSESVIRVFFRGFFWPVRQLWYGLGWIAHHPPLKQIGHGLRWFFATPPLRLLGHILGFRFVASSWQELRLVTWPGWKESRRLTSAVIVFSVVFGVLIAVVDFGLDKLFKQVFLK